MTQKELLYVEDAICHERIINANINDMLNILEDEDLIDYMNKELKQHEKHEKDLMKLLEDSKNE